MVCALCFSPIVSGVLARCWVRGCRVSQLRLRHLTCGRAVARTRMPHVRGVAPARRDPPETRRPMCNASKEENSRAPRIADVPATTLVGRPCGNHSGFDVAPEGDEQLAGHGHNGDPSRAPRQLADALAEPHCQLAAGLVAKPEPCELDHGRSSTRVSGPTNATIAVHPGALVGRRRDADVACDLSAVVE